MKLAIITPVFNDWESFFELAGKMYSNPELKVHEISLFAVNDCSTANIPAHNKGQYSNINIIHGVRNLGHQKAIAIGLSYVQVNFTPDAVIIMDADGEDRPEDILALITALESKPGKIIFAQRAKRYESGSYKGFYALYKSLFATVTGESISFGNFSIIPGNMLFKVVHLYEIWNNYPGGIMRSRLPYSGIMVRRGSRYYGESKMNFVSLVIHGLSAMSVYLDVISVRMLLLQIIMVVLLATILIAVAVVALFSHIDIPQWLITMSLVISVAFVVNVFMSFMLTFMVLHYRSQQTFIPKYDALRFIEKVEQY